MFVYCQNFAGSWGCNFESNCFVKLQFRAIYYFDKHFWGRKVVGKSNPLDPQTSMPHEQ